MLIEKLIVLENIDLILLGCFLLTIWLLLWFPIGCLAAWRLTNIISWEEIANRFRGLFGGYWAIDHDVVLYKPIKFLGKETSFFGELLSCFWCTSVWVGILVFMLILVFPWILLPFALSAVAIIIERQWET